MRLFQYAIELSEICFARDISPDRNIWEQNVIIAVADQMDILETCVIPKLRLHALDVTRREPHVALLQDNKARVKTNEHTEQ